MIIIFKFLGFIVLFLLVLALVFVFIGFSVLRKVLFKKRTVDSRTNTYSGPKQASYANEEPEDKIGKIYAEKIFDKDEGEYVEFEEIPDRDK